VEQNAHIEVNETIPAPARESNAEEETLVNLEIPFNAVTPQSSSTK